MTTRIGRTLLTVGLLASTAGIAAAALPDVASATHAGTATACDDSGGIATIGGLTLDYSNGATVTDDSGNPLGVLPGDLADHPFAFTNVGVGGTLRLHVVSLASPQHRAGDYTHTFELVVQQRTGCVVPPQSTTTTAAATTTTTAATTTTGGGATTTTAAHSTTTAPHHGGLLPATGTMAVLLAAVGSLLVAAGALALMAGRRPGIAE
jgi:hypothetical protein